MTIYLIMLITSLFTIVMDRLEISFIKTSFTLVTLFLMAFIVFFRNVSVGTDYRLYNTFFYSNPQNLYSSFIERGYITINSIAQFFNNFQLIGITLFFILLIGLYTISKTFNVSFQIVIAVYVLTYTFYSSLNLTRQYYAVAISMVGVSVFFKYLDKKNIFAILLFFIFVIIAKQFHSSGYFLLSFVILPYIRVNKKLVFFIALISSFLYFYGGFTQEIITIILKFDPTYVQKYGLNINVLTGYSSKGIFYFVLMIIQFILLYFAVEYFDSKRKKDNFILSGVIFNLVMYIGGYNNIFSRIQVYTLVFQILFLSILIKKRNNKVNFIIFGVISIWIILYVYRIITNNSGIVPFSII